MRSTACAELDYTSVQRALEFSKIVLSQRRYAEAYKLYAEGLANSLAEKVPLHAAFATGYPFYLLSPSLPAEFKIPEFEEFLSRTQDSLYRQIAKNSQSNWVCPDCQTSKALPDLKTFCKPCQKVDFKPRDLFKALPDVDLTLVIEPSAENLTLIDDQIKGMGLIVSDPDIKGSVEAFNKGIISNDPSKFVLVDVHIMDADIYMKCLSDVSIGVETKSSVVSYRGNNKWDYNEKLPFSFDYLFSMTPIGDGKLHGNNALAETMSLLDIDPDSCLTKLKSENRSNKIGRMLSDKLTYGLIRSAVISRFPKLAVQK